MSSSRRFLVALQQQCRSHGQKISSRASGSLILTEKTTLLRDLPPVQILQATSSITERWIATEAVTASNSDETKSASKKKKKLSRKNKKQKKMIQLLQLQDLHSQETVKEHYEVMARQTELGKLKWIGNLKEKLEESSPTEDGWTQTQAFLKRKSIPQHVNDGFWDLIVAKTARKKKKEQPNNTVQKDHDVRVFQRARELSLEFPFFWSATRKRRVQKMLKKGKKKTLDQFLQERSEILGNLHQSKSLTEQELESRQLVETLQGRLPAKYYDKLVALFQEYIEACESEKQGFSSDNTSNDEIDEGDDDADDADGVKSKVVKRRIKMLFSNIQGQTQTHVHLVASELTGFFYVNVADDGKSADHEDIVSSDIRVQKSQKDWNDAKDQFVASFMSIQAMLSDEHSEKTGKSGAEESDGNSEQDTEEGDEEEDLVDVSEESVLATFQDAAAATNEVKYKSKQRFKPRFYTVFEALSIGDWANTQNGGQSPPESTVQGTPLEASSFPSTPPADRLVFIDNLPIDITENRLMDAYSRCGDIEDLQVFHRRPDLDPGRQSDDSRKKIRNPSSSRQKWQRPKTPLYAMILYRDSAGASKAVTDPLRIFGMVLDKHLIRSYRASDMTKLYVEDVASTHDVSSIEYQLSQLLHPELYVCLDIGRRQRRTVGTSSCEIKFPTFEAAYWSYLKLSAELELLNEEGCALHWMETPRDAVLYWTRHLNF